MKYFTLAFILFFINNPLLFSQLHKGDLAIDFSSNFLQTNDRRFEEVQPDRQLFVSPRIGKMVNDKLMIGSGLNFSYSLNQNIFSGNYKSRDFTISPFMRYYFLGSKKVMPYLFFDSRLGHFNVDHPNPIFSDKGWTVAAAGGFGANLFLAPNLALQAEIRTKLLETRNSGGLSSVLFANFGVATFINERQFEKTGIREKYLCKGNYIYTGSGHFSVSENILIQPSFNQPHAKIQYKSWSAEAGITRFTNDRLASTLEAQISGSGNGTNKTFSLGVGAGVEKYMPLNKKEKLFLVASIKINPSYSSMHDYIAILTSLPTPGGPFTLDTIQQKNHWATFRETLGASFKYFTEGSSIWALGIDYQMQQAKLFGQSSMENHARWRVVSKMEYFFTRNLNLTTSLSYHPNYTYDNIEGRFFFPGGRDGIRRWDLSFSINCFIFNEKCAERKM